MEQYLTPSKIQWLANQIEKMFYDPWKDEKPSEFMRNHKNDIFPALWKLYEENNEWKYKTLAALVYQKEKSRLENELKELI